MMFYVATIVKFGSADLRSHHLRPMRRTPPPDPKKRGNRLTAGICVAFFVGMVGMAYAAVPLYAMFCQVTGYGGTTQRVEQYSDRCSTARSRCASTPTLRRHCPGISSRPQRDMTMRIGETAQAHYTATNLFDAAGHRQRHVQRHAGAGRRLFQQGRVLLLHRHHAAAGRNAGHAGRLLRRSGYRRRAGTEGPQDDHAFLHLLPVDGEKPLAARPRRSGGTATTRRKTRGLTWQTHTPNRSTTTTSSTRARGRSSARSARSSWRSAASPGCSIMKGNDFPSSASTSPPVAVLHRPADRALHHVRLVVGHDQGSA